MPPETTREKAERYVREGEEYVAGQEAIVAELKILGRSTREARALLLLFEDSLAGHKRNLAALNVETWEERTASDSSAASDPKRPLTG